MRTLSTFRMGVEQLSPLSIFRPDDFSTRPQPTSPCDTVPRNDKSCSAGVIRAASWPDPAVVEQILMHLGVAPANARSDPQSARLAFARLGSFQSGRTK